MKQLLKEAREKLVESVHNKTISQSEINRLFNQLESEFSTIYDIKPSNNTYFSTCNCCNTTYKSGELSNGLCGYCNTEIRRIERVRTVKKYMKESGI